MNAVKRKPVRTTTPALKQQVGRDFVEQAYRESNIALVDESGAPVNFAESQIPSKVLLASLRVHEKFHPMTQRSFNTITLAETLSETLKCDVGIVSGGISIGYHGKTESSGVFTSLPITSGYYSGSRLKLDYGVYGPGAPVGLPDVKWRIKDGNEVTYRMVSDLRPKEFPLESRYVQKLFWSAGVILVGEDSQPISIESSRIPLPALAASARLIKAFEGMRAKGGSRIEELSSIISSSMGVEVSHVTAGVSREDANWAVVTLGSGEYDGYVIDLHYDSPRDDKRSLPRLTWRKGESNIDSTTHFISPLPQEFTYELVEGRYLNHGLTLEGIDGPIPLHKSGVPPLILAVAGEAAVVFNIMLDESRQGRIHDIIHSLPDFMIANNRYPTQDEIANRFPGHESSLDRLSEGASAPRQSVGYTLNRNSPDAQKIHLTEITERKTHPSIFEFQWMHPEGKMTYKLVLP